MNVGNFLTVISILIAFVSFAYNRNRKIILYKFTCCNVIVTLVFLLLSNCCKRMPCKRFDYSKINYEQTITL